MRKQAIEYSTIRNAAYKALERAGAKTMADVPRGHRLEKAMQRAYSKMDKARAAGKERAAEKYDTLAYALNLGKEGSVDSSVFRQALVKLALNLPMPMAAPTTQPEHMVAQPQQGVPNQPKAPQVSVSIGGKSGQSGQGSSGGGFSVPSVPTRTTN